MDWLTWLRLQWDRALALLALVAGILLLFLGWRGVSHSPLTAEQIPYLVSGGLGGLFALGVAATLWISADLRDEWRKLDVLQDEWGTAPTDATTDRAEHALSAPSRERSATAPGEGTAGPRQRRTS